MKNKLPDNASPAEILKFQQHAHMTKMRTRIIIISVIAVIIAFICTIFGIFGITSVKGNSMYPSLKDGDVIVYARTDNEYEINDVVVFDYDNDKCIKRIAAAEGDTVDIDSTNGTLLVNNIEISDDGFYSTNTKAKTNKIICPYKVQNDELFVLGDNRDLSTDSREYGAINREDVLGKVVKVIRSENF